MSTLVVDTLTGKSTATTLTIGSTPVVSASANSLTIRGEGSAQTSVQQGLAKAWGHIDQTSTGHPTRDSYNISSTSDTAAGSTRITFTSAMVNSDFCTVTTCTAVTTYEDNSCGQPISTSTMDNYNSNGTTQTDHSRASQAVFGDLA